MKDHIKPLTSLRFFAAFAIVIFHMKEILPFERPQALATAVSFFFVLSGFILTVAYTERYKTSRYFLNRFARLWPVHALTFIITLVVLDTGAERGNYTLELAIANLTLVQAWLPFVGVPFSFNGPSWSISSEFFFYLIFPFLLKARTVWPFVIFAAISILCLVGIEVLTVPLEPPFKIFDFRPQHFVGQHPLVRMLEFILGVVTGRLFLRRGDFGLSGKLKRQTLEILIFIPLIIYWITMLTTSDWLDQYLGADMIGLWYYQAGGLIWMALLIYGISLRLGFVSKLLSNPILVVFGRFSFVTYMFHQIVIHWWINKNYDAVWWQSVGVILLITYIGSYLIWAFFEEPMKRLIVNRFGRRR